jgi:hypothetical protein
LPNDNIKLVNNVFSVTINEAPLNRIMGIISGGSNQRITNGLINNNLYYNNGKALSTNWGSDTEVKTLSFANDLSKVVADPLIETNLKLSNVTTPTWNGTIFAGGYDNIEQARVALAIKFAKPTSSTSPVYNTADALNMPKRDILYRLRDSNPDIGAYEWNE